MVDCVEIAFAGWERDPKGFRQELGREIFRWFREKVLDRERDFSLEGSFAAAERLRHRKEGSERIFRKVKKEVDRPLREA